MAGADLTANKVAVAPLSGEVHRRGRAGFAAFYFPQIKRAAKMTAGLPSIAPTN